MTAELRKRPAAASSKSPQPAASSPAAADDDSKPPAGKRLPSVLRWAGIGLASLVIMAMGFYGYVKYRNGPYRHRDYDGDLLFTQDMLLEAKAKAANDKDAPIYLSIVGHVFDVSNGRHFYGPGGGYEFFTFRDGSRAFVTGKFDEEGLTDDLVGLSRDECKGVYRWLTFFEDKDKYFYAGKLVGRFFDRAGRPTPALKDFIECAEVAKTEGADGSEADKPVYCNSQWSYTDGGSVWCDGDGQVPRRPRLEDGTLGRCVCVSLEAAREQPDSHAGYDGCAEDSSSCVTQPPPTQ